MIDNSLKRILLAVSILCLASGVYAETKMSVVAVATQTGEASFFGTPSTTVKLKITLPKPIFKIDSKQSKLVSIIDDTGADILDKAIKWRGQQSYYSVQNRENNIDFSDSTIEQNTIIVPINVTATASKDANTITIKADLTFHCYPEDTVQHHTSDMLKVNDIRQNMIFGNTQVKWIEVATGNNGGKALTFFDADTNVIIDKMLLYDAQGTALMTIHPIAQQNVEIETDMLPKIKQVALVYRQPVIIKVPVDIQTNGIGLP